MNFREYQAKQRALKQLNSQEVVSVKTVQTTSAVLEIALQNDINKIRQLPSLAERADYKRDHFLPKWLPFVEEYITRGDNYQNDAFIYCIIYLFDVGNLDRALEMADVAIKQNQSMPESFKSNLPTFVADQVYQWISKTASTGESVEPYFTQTFKKVADSWQLHEVITAKWYKLAASLLLRNKQGTIHAASIKDQDVLYSALYFALAAKNINFKCGINAMIDRIVMRLKRLSPSTDPTQEVLKVTFSQAFEVLRIGTHSKGERDV